MEPEGYIKLSSFGRAVSPAVQKEVLAKEESLQSSKVRRAVFRPKFVIFQGPMKDRDGKERIAAGHELSTKDLAEMNWFVPGVQGTLPKK
jgi:hypothetical protein